MARDKTELNSEQVLQDKSPYSRIVQSGLDGSGFLDYLMKRRQIILIELAWIEDHLKIPRTKPRRER